MFLELTILICLAAVLAIIFRFLRQPPILAYIVTGILIGPFHLLELHDIDVLRNMGQLGIALLLFLLGLELRFSDLKSVGKVAVLSSLIHMTITAGMGYVLAIFLGFPVFEAVYIALALVFSSTIIVVKLLSDKKDMHSLYGKISVGFLLVQDFFAILCMLFLSSYTPGESALTTISYFLGMLLKGTVLVTLIVFVSKTILPKLIHSMARSSETLFLFSLAWVFGIAALVNSPLIGFSVEIGGFLAGLALANAVENFQIVSKMRPLRDFFVTIFFIFLGIEMVIGNVTKVLFPAIIFSLFVLLTKPFIMMVIMKVLGYRKRTSFLTGINVAQISEFSLILLVIAHKMGHISTDVISLITIVAVITFGTSTYMILQNNKLYMLFHRYIQLVHWKSGKEEEIGDTGELSEHVVLVGADHMGQSIIDTLKKTDEKLVVVDFDPDVVRSLNEKGIASIFGDIADIDIQERAYLEKAKIVVSTVSDVEDNLLLMKALRHVNKKTKIIVMALSIHEAKILYEHGADYVVLPHLAGGRQIARALKTGEFEKLDELREKDKEYLL